MASGPAYADMAVLRGDTSDGLPGSRRDRREDRGEAHRPLRRPGRAARGHRRGDPEIKGAQRARLEAGAAYLDVAPMVVKVAHDAPVPEVDADAAERRSPTPTSRPPRRGLRADQLVQARADGPRHHLSLAVEAVGGHDTTHHGVAGLAGGGPQRRLRRGVARSAPSRSTTCLQRRTKSPAAMSWPRSTASRR